MCGRTTVTISRREVADLLAVERVETDELPLSWNVVPSQHVYAVRAGSLGERALVSARWGLIPSWSSAPGLSLTNARAETITTKPAFSSLIGTRRALVPVSGFYEWRRQGHGRHVTKQPYYFHGADGGPLVFAGLWDRWADAEGRVLESCAIITTSANATMAPIHHRMPVVLVETAWSTWLQPGPVKPGELGEILAPAPNNLLAVHPVGDEVNSALNDGPTLIKAVPEIDVPAQLELLGPG